MSYQVNKLTQLIKTNTKFKDFVKEEEKKAGDRFESFLITPIQRIPRYEMLLNAALKYTKEDQSDYDKLKKAVALVHVI